SHALVTALTRSCTRYRPHPRPPPFPTRRSSDLRSTKTPDHRERSARRKRDTRCRTTSGESPCSAAISTRRSPSCSRTSHSIVSADRKSTRLNSSHVKISYAVFCLKKKKKNKDTE